MAPEEDVPEGNSWGCLLTLSCQNLPLTALVGWRGATFWACTEHEGNPSDSCPSECSSPHREASVFTANYCRRCIWVLPRLQIPCKFLLHKSLTGAFSSHLPLSPGIKLQKQPGWRRTCQRGVSASALLQPRCSLQWATMKCWWATLGFHSYGDMFSEHWLK